MIEKEITITIKDGLHARPASDIVRNLSRFTSDVEFHYNNRTYNAKSILGLMGASIKEGQTITLKIVGEDEQEAYDWLVNFL